MRLFKELIIVGLAGFALLYLFFPSFIPDFLPLVGWIDEGIATTVVLSALSHWGLDLTGLFGKDRVQLVNQIESKDEPKDVKNFEVSSQLADGTTRKIRIPREVLERALAEYQQEQAQG